MKNLFIIASLASATLVSCGTVQSIVQNTFPYTANVLVSTGVPAHQQVTSKSTATNVQSWFGGNNNAQIKDVRIADAKVAVVSPSNRDLSALKSIKVYLSSDGNTERLVASRDDINTSSKNITLDLHDTRFLDNMVKNNNLEIKTVYTLKNQTSTDLNLKVALNFSSIPAD